MTLNQKPFKPCTKFGCGKLTRSRYCDDHQSEYRNQNRIYDSQIRNQKLNSFYHSASWKKARAILKVRDNGLCQQCLIDKRLTVGTEVDHIIPIKLDWSKRLDLDNLWLLCKACHNKKTGRERRGQKG